MAITELSVKNAALQFLGEPPLATTSDDVAARYALDVVWLDAINYVLAQAPWRWALKTAAMTGATSSLIVGYTHSVAKPADWVRTHSIYALVSNGAKEYPIDFKEQALRWHTNGASFTARYISTDYDDPDDWTEQFARALAVYLAFLLADSLPGDPARAARLYDLFKEYLANAIAHDALPEDPFLQHQMDGSFLAAGRTMLEKAFWNFALKTATPSTGGSAISGYLTSYAKPSDWMRTHAIYKLSGAKECPLDVKEQGAYWNANEAIKVRYISTAYLDSTLWPEEFLRLVAAYLGIEMGDGGVADAKEGKALLWPSYLESAARDIAVAPNPWLAPQLDGSFLAASKALLEKEFWRFALKTVAPSTGGSALTGYSTSYAQPADYLRTQSIFKLVGAKECPLDIREQGVNWSSNEAFKLRYLSTAGLDSTLWPEEFTQVVAAYLGFDVDGETDQSKGKEWPVYLEAAARDIAVKVDPWLEHQLNGHFLSASQTILEKAFWRFSLKTVAPSTGGSALSGYSTSYAQPADFLRTHAIYKLSGAKECPLDVREQGVNWSSNEAFKLRYLSTAGLDSSLWPEQFTRTVAAYLGFEMDGSATDKAQPPSWPAYFAIAERDLAVHPNPWLPSQLDGNFLAASQAILERAFWRFSLKTATPSTGGSALSGYSTSYAKPSDYLKTQALYKLSSARECPLDLREQKVNWSANEAFKVRYLSTDGLDSTLWPEEFTRIVAAYLGFDVDGGRPVTKDGESVQAVWPVYLAQAEKQIAVPIDPWLQYELDGRFLAASRTILEKAFWRFALVTATPSSSGSAVAGFSTAYPKPAAWLKTHAIFKLTGAKEYPLDCREQGTSWSSNEAIKVRYISDAGLDSSLWPEEFTRTVAAYLGFDVDSGDTLTDENKQRVWPAYLANAAETCAIPPSPWLEHQLSGSFLSASRAILEKAFWNFALKTATPTSSGTAVPGFTTSYAKPSDWLRTHAIFKVSGSKELPVDVREQGGFWSASEAIKVRYISTAYLDASLWPEQFLRVVTAYLGIDMGDAGTLPSEQNGQEQKPLLWPTYLKQAIAEIAVPDNPWLTYQLDASYLPGVQYVLEQGMWRFAVETAGVEENGDTALPGYTYKFDRPDNWIRTVRVTRSIGTTNEEDIDYQEEDGTYSTNYNPITLRWLDAVKGRNPENWSDAFQAAVLAHLSYQRALSNPDTPGAVLAARKQAYESILDNARSKDDMRERPVVNNVGRLTRSRGGWGYGSTREQGW